MARLESCDALFRRFFDRWYSDDDRAARGFPATRPDMIGAGGKPGDAAPAESLTEEAREAVSKQIDGMLEAARGDWPASFEVGDTVDATWLDAFDRYYDRKRVADVVKRSDPSDFGNDYLIICCELGAVIGHVMQSQRPRLLWRHDWPYWDSMLFDPERRFFVPVFHWAIKKMSDYAVDDGLVAKTNSCLVQLG